MSERRRGLYALLSLPAVYDLCQALLRSKASRCRFFNEHVRPGQADRVLDIGCGTGDALSHLTTNEYVGVDANPYYIGVARVRYPNRGIFVAGDVTDLQQQTGNGFDIALALGVLHHLDDDGADAALREIAHALSPTGRLVMHDPVLTDSQSRVARWFVMRDRGPHVRTDALLVSLARRHFEVVHTTINERPLRIPYTEIIMECERPIRRSTRNGGRSCS